MAEWVTVMEGPEKSPQAQAQILPELPGALSSLRTSYLSFKGQGKAWEGGPSALHMHTCKHTVCVHTYMHMHGMCPHAVHTR